MKARYGFVSNSSSSSFIIGFDKPITKRRDIKFKQKDFEESWTGKFSEKDLEHMFYWMVRSGNCETLDEYLSLELRCKMLYEKIDFDKILERVENLSFVDSVTKKTLKKVATWEHPEYALVFSIGSDSDFNMFTFEGPDYDRDHMISNWAQRNFDSWKDLVDKVEYI